MLPPRATSVFLSILVLTASSQPADDEKKDEVFVTVVMGGSGGSWAGELLLRLVAARLREFDVTPRAVPPPAPCAARPLAAACRLAVLRRLTDASAALQVALLPAPLAQGALPSLWELRDRSVVDLGDASRRPPRRRCLAPPPVRSLADLPAAAAVLVSDDETAAVVHNLSPSAQVRRFDESSLSAMNSTSRPLVVCDFAPELGLTLPRTWNDLGSPPCYDVECPFEGRRLAKLASAYKLFQTLRVLTVIESFKLEGVEELREVHDRAREVGTDVAVAEWLAANPKRNLDIQVRTVALVPNASWLDPALAARPLAAAAELAEVDAPPGSMVRFKVEVQAKCSAADVAEYLDGRRDSDFGSLSALAGPACGAGWREAARPAALLALPLLGYTAQEPGAAPALLASGAARAAADALAAWLAARGWRRLALLAPAEHARVAAPALQADLAAHLSLDEPGRDLNVPHLQQWAARVVAADARVLYVWSEDARAVAAALCELRAAGVAPAAGAVLLLPPLDARALLAAAPCPLRAMLDGHFTVAPAWRAAWDGWDAPAGAAGTAAAGAAAERAAWEPRWRAQAGRGRRGAGDAGGAGPPAAAALLYDLLRLWAAALRRVVAEEPYVIDNLHKDYLVRKILANATGHEYTGLTGKFEWRAENNNTYVRESPMVIAQWDDDGGGGGGVRRQVAAWASGQLQERPGVLRWRTADGRAPDHGGGACALRRMARGLRVSCAAAWALLTAAGAAALLAALAGAACVWRRRAERSFRRRLAALGLTALPAGADRWEVPRERVVINRKLGTGAFGTVYGGHALLGERGWSAVAVKTLKPGASTEEKLDFLAEAEAMKRLDHKNVVRLLGVVTKTEPVCTVMEFMLYGDLKTYLLARRHVADECEVGARRLTAMALDAARALSYLAEQRWVHRDVAARNCLVSARRVLKLADFGMARRVYDGDYYRLRRRGMLPVRWMAPEALAAGEFSAASDVWALGVLLYEIVTLGALPYAGLDNAEVLARVRAGRAMEPPPGAAPPLAALLRACWAADARARPGAAEVAAWLAEQPRLLAPVPPPAPDALPLQDAHRAAALWRAHDALASAATDTTYVSDARDTDRCLPARGPGGPDPDPDLDLDLDLDLQV